MQNPFDNDTVFLMKTPKSNIEEKTYDKNPKLILDRLNITTTDDILVRDNKIYIAIKEMTGQRETEKRNIVRGGKIFVEYQHKENSNFTALDTSVEYSLWRNKNKTQTKTYQFYAQNGSSDLHSKPLRQIDGNVKTKNIIVLSGEELLDEFEVTSCWSPDQSPDRYSKGYCSPNIRKQKDKWSNGICRGVGLKKPLKRLNSSNNSFPTLFTRLKSVFLSRNANDTNHSNVIKKSQELFHNRCDSVRERNIDPDEAEPNVLQRSSRVGCSGPTVTSNGHSCSCKVTLERIDTKICFMYCLGLMPTVKTDLRQMCKLSLFRKYNIRNCSVVISKLSVEAGGKY